MESRFSLTLSEQIIMASPDTSFSAQQELDSYWEWWRSAGVEHDYQEIPREWFETADGSAAVSAPVAKQNAEPLIERNNAPPVQHAPLPPLAEEHMQRDNANTQPAEQNVPLPDSFDDILPWWQSSPALTMASGLGPRILPVLKSQPKLLIISDMPEEDDEEILFSGASGRLLSNILGTVNIETDQAAFLSLWPQYSLAPEMEMDKQAHWNTIISHLIELIAPQSIILCGKLANLVVTGNDLAENRRSLPNINHDGRSIPADVSLHPRTLLARPTMKRTAWKDWLRIGESLNEVGAVQP